jgi:diguanylate cyclase (GGDEF)-like protein
MAHRWQSHELLEEGQSVASALAQGRFDGYGHRALIVMDIDGFREFNREQGREKGNLLLKELWGLILNSIPRKAYALRYGGEEFLIVTDGKERATEIAQIIRHDFGDLAANTSGITLSFGVGELPERLDVDVLLEKFNDISLAAQHTAKLEGGNRIIHVD